MKVDRFGHCVVCQKNMLFEQVVDGKVIKRFSADKTSKCFMLNDGSRMNVCICKSCKKIEGNEDEIMEACINGWDAESEDLVKDESKGSWTKEFKKKYMDRMSKIEIIGSAEGKDEFTITQEFKRYKVKKEKE